MIRYLSQARELDKLGGAQKTIKIETCDSSQTGGPAARAGISHARRLRLRSGARNRQRHARLPDHRFRISAGRTGTGAAHQSAVRVRLQADAGADPLRSGLLAFGEGEQAEGGEFIDYFIGDPSFAACTWGSPSSIPPTAESCARASRFRDFAPMRTCWISTAACSRSETVKPWCRAARATRKIWAELVGVAPDKGSAFFERLVAKDDGWLASYFDALVADHLDPANGPVLKYLTRSGASEAVLPGDSRQSHQPRPGSAGFPIQHRHDAAHHAAASGSGREAAHSGRARGMAHALHRTSRTANTTPS